MQFTFQLGNQASFPQKIRLEYAIDYVKADGKPSRKVFKISERNCPSGNMEIVRRQPFKDLTTRKHYEGWHRFFIIVNGQPLAEETFYLKVDSIGRNIGLTDAPMTDINAYIFYGKSTT
ncbi:hypothetical protein [Salinithrix halophila]|uniref:Uncharacterized protein n=1 Tax=Salinithrix halophila TaxID=1485204 RepID=A0ABV8JJY4_9BACL